MRSCCAGLADRPSPDPVLWCNFVSRSCTRASSLAIVAFRSSTTSVVIGAISTRFSECRIDEGKDPATINQAEEASRGWKERIGRREGGCRGRSGRGRLYVVCSAALARGGGFGHQERRAGRPPSLGQPPASSGPAIRQFKQTTTAVAKAFSGNIPLPTFYELHLPVQPARFRRSYAHCLRLRYAYSIDASSPHLSFLADAADHAGDDRRDTFAGVAKRLRRTSRSSFRGGSLRAARKRFAKASGGCATWAE
jgi:hypothetical protein